MADHAILILCTGNSARSILGEALVGALPGFTAYSAGSQPKGSPHPMAHEVLADNGFETGAFRSKSWDEFGEGGRGAPKLDIVITVCDSAAAETCPLWMGAPVRAHWGVPDPAAVTGSEADVRAAFVATFDALKARAARLGALPVASMNAAELQAALNAIGRMDHMDGEVA